MASQDYEETNAEIIEKVAQAVGTANNSDEAMAAFSEVMLEYLSTQGDCEDGIAFHYRKDDEQVNGYGYGNDPEMLDVYVSEFFPNETSCPIESNAIRAAIVRAINFIVNSYTGSQARMTNEAADLRRLLRSGMNREIKTVRVILLTNGRNVDDWSGKKKIVLDSLLVKSEIWDLLRLHRLLQRGDCHEPVNTDFGEKFDTPIPCVEIKSQVTEYTTYLAAFPGNVLADLYEEYGTRLMQRNVRVYLQDTGKVNKGILETIKTEPQMFLAYNNGISLTARAIDLVKNEEGQLCLGNLIDFQIVNGGQTTASLHNARKNYHADLSQIYVQAKISVIHDGVPIDDIVQAISQYSNSQNTIKGHDLQANGPYHKELERLSRFIAVPGKNIKWFYERARGAYKVARLEGGKQFEKEFPKSCMFTKVDLAKYLFAWKQCPYIVSKGNEKCFRQLTIALADNRSLMPDVRYYKEAIGMAVLYRGTTAIVKELGYQAYKANIIAYTISVLSVVLGGRLDFEQLWEAQELPMSLAKLIANISREVEKRLKATSGNKMPSEWAKKAECWDAIRQCASQFSGNGLEGLIGGDGLESSDGFVLPEDQDNEVMALTATQWFAASEAFREIDHESREWYCGFLGSIGGTVASGKRLSARQQKCCRKALAILKEHGYSI